MGVQYIDEPIGDFSTRGRSGQLWLEIEKPVAAQWERPLISARVLSITPHIDRFSRLRH